MFSGIISALGSIGTMQRVTPAANEQGLHRVGINIPSTMATDLQQGDSVAVNGVCLTVESIEQTTADDDTGYIGWFSIGATTGAKTTAASWTQNQPVNLEQSVQVGQRLDGHIVQGHVQGIGTIADIASLPQQQRLITVAVPAQLMPCCIPEGSVAIDGVSLTISDVDIASNHIHLSIIPYTLQHTTLGSYQIGNAVNIETDMMIRAVQWGVRIAQQTQPTS